MPASNSGFRGIDREAIFGNDIDNVLADFPPSSRLALLCNFGVEDSGPRRHGNVIGIARVYGSGAPRQCLELGIHFRADHICNYRRRWSSDWQSSVVAANPSKGLGHFFREFVGLSGKESYNPSKMDRGKEVLQIKVQYPLSPEVPGSI
jgi:hypothetical protein